MPGESPDPRTVDVVVVHAEDVVAALAATAQGRDTVLRVTPPFRRRQRARIHVPSDAELDESGGEGNDEDESAPLLVPVAAFVDTDAPGFPRAPETEPEPADSDAYDVDEHYDRHADAVAAWRNHVREHFLDDVAVASSHEESCEFEVRYLHRES